MILVTTGTNGSPFDRLLLELDGLGDGEPVIVQHGPSFVRPRGATCVPYLTFDELVARIRNARVVVTHAGVGSVVIALMNGRRPVVVPRLAEFGEVVDDHQLVFARRASEAGLVTLTMDPAQLRDVLSSCRADQVAPEILGAGGLVEELGTYLRSACPAHGSGATARASNTTGRWTTG